MSIELSTVEIAELPVIVETLRRWQRNEPAIHLHPGDIGWFWRFGADATAAAIRTWSRDGRMLAIALLDGPDLVRMTIDPDLFGDAELTEALRSDLADPARGVLPDGAVFLEAPMAAAIQDAMLADGWVEDQPMSPLRRDLSAPVEHPGLLHIRVIGADQADVRAELQRAAFDRSTFTVEKWQTMADGVAYRDARCLVGFAGGEAVATITIWSAGAGRPGLIEPMGVHRDHRGHGYGRAITLAGAAMLRELGSSSAIVETATSNAAGVATYRSAGMVELPGVRDLARKA